MEIDTRYGQYWDLVAVAQYNVVRRMDDPTMERAFAVRYLKFHLECLMSGRAAVGLMGHGFIEEKIREVDDNLRLRWDYEHVNEQNEPDPMYAIDRFVPQLGYHFTVFYWSHRLGDGSGLKQVLRESDMMNPDYRDSKRRRQDGILQNLSKKRDEMALEAVDSLSREQIKEFIAVEMALQSGEKIHVRGKDAEILNRMYENTKRMDAIAADAGITLPPIPDSRMCINPNMNPLTYKRRSRQ